MEHKGTVWLETERLILRPFCMDDLEEIYNNCWSKKEVWKWTSYDSMECVEDVITNAGMFTEKWLSAYEDKHRYSWAIQVKNSGEVIGRFFGMHPDDQVGQIEFAYEIGPDWWNQGYMTEVVRRMIAFFLDEVGMNRVFAYHAENNPASGEVMKKSGMHYEGTLRKAGYCNCGVIDQIYYSALADDYEKGI